MIDRNPLEQWLDAATNRLPRDLAPALRDELETHYWDAVDGYTLDGQTPEGAAVAALRDLGDPQETATALRHTHLAARRYQLAAAASAFSFSIIIILTLMANPVTIVQTNSFSTAIVAVSLMAGFNLFTIACTLYVLRVLLSLPEILRPFDDAIKMMRRGLAVLLILAAINLSLSFFPDISRLQIFVFNDPMAFYNFELATMPRTAPEFVVSFGTATSMIVVGCSWLWLGLRLTGRLFGLALPLRFLMIASGLLMLLQVLGLIFLNPALTWFGVLLAVPVYPAKYAVLVLLFFRANRQHNKSPYLYA